MPKLSVFAGLLGFVSVAYAWYPNPAEVFSARYQPYFESLRLHYETPRGCVDGQQKTYYGKTPTCEVAADFNGDGSADYAALIEYIGGDLRSGNRYLDLIILYSSPNNSGVAHELYTHVGRVNERGEISRFLKIEETGEIVLPSGPWRLDRPALSLLDTSGKYNDNFWAFPTFYWIEDKFVSLNKATD